MPVTVEQDVNFVLNERTVVHSTPSKQNANASKQNTNAQNGKRNGKGSPASNKNHQVLVIDKG